MFTFNTLSKGYFSKYNKHLWPKLINHQKSLVSWFGAQRSSEYNLASLKKYTWCLGLGLVGKIWLLWRKNPTWLFGPGLFPTPLTASESVTPAQRPLAGESIWVSCHLLWDVTCSSIKELLPPLFFSLYSVNGVAGKAKTWSSAFFFFSGMRLL